MKIVKRKIKKAFTIAEMAIVIMIIGVLISLIVMAGGYLENGKNQAFIYELNTYRQAVFKFYNTYHALPGDFANASSSINNTLLDGNGNMKYNVISATSNESYLAWKHFAYSTILPNNLTGITTVSNTQTSVVGTNLPKSKVFPNGGFRLGSDISNEISQNPTIGGKYFVLLEFASYLSQDTSTGRGISGIIKAVSMQNIDAKIDDSNPLEGFLFGLNDANAICNSSNSRPTSSAYVANVQYQNSKLEGCIFSLVLNEY